MKYIGGFWKDFCIGLKKKKKDIYIESNDFFLLLEIVMIGCEGLDRSRLFF